MHVQREVKAYCRLKPTQETNAAGREPEGSLYGSKLARMIYPIVKFGDPVLEKPSAIITEFNDELRKLAEDMFESMYAAHGVGLAAPQIGIAKRIAVIDVTFKEDPDARIVLVNPEIVRTEGKQTSNEGCLSLPEFRENVTRPMKVTARAQDLDGKTIEVTGEELLARALLHETDHLNGKLFISHISALKRDLIKRKIRKLMRQGEWK
jgi:peptide deformylase